MNEDEFDSLRRWGEALSDDPRPEVMAAGKAIRLLAQEVERLQVELWHSRIGIEPARREAGREAVEEETIAALPAGGELENDLQSTFARVARRLHAPRVFHRG